jgi:glycosyltransferase involved in cell wall biosynthesis
MRPNASFIIPALNEQEDIGDTLDCIRAQAPRVGSVEVIVVDNGSSDGTAAIARARGAEVIVLPDVTVASLRNHGARRARGEILIFLDADVRLTDDWGRGIEAALGRLRRDPNVITGARCTPPDDPNWIERLWFAEIATEGNVTHIGTGHMILTRELFERLGGLDEKLVTGEDYDLCRRASASGARIVNDRSLRVTHHGYPTTIAEFVRREAWHGTSDFTSWSVFRRSPVALATTAFAAAHAVLFVNLMWPRSGWIAVLAGTLIAAVTAASSLHKYRHSAWSVRTLNAAMFYWYYVGRTIALFRAARTWFGKRRAISL